MDGLSGAAAVAAVATFAAQLSKALFEAYLTVKGAEDEIRDIANNVSLLALVLAEMEECLRENSSFFRPSLEQTALTIAARCESIFKDIEKHTGVQRGKAVRKGLAGRLGWFFKKDRVKLLRVSLESLKSTLNILLHVVVLARLSTDSQIRERYVPIICMDWSASLTDFAVTLLENIANSKKKDVHWFH